MALSGRIGTIRASKSTPRARPDHATSLRIEQNFVTEAPNQVWVTDITYIPTAEGWLYLAGHKDLFKRLWATPWENA